jgi:hypothetical protein
MYSIANYEELYMPTNSKGGELVHAVFVKMPVKPRGKGLKSLLKNAKGLEVFGVWTLLLQAATETTNPKNRGKLLNHKDEPANSQEIAEAISLDNQVKKVEEALSVLVEMGWVQYVQSTDKVRTNSVQDADNVPHKISKDKISKGKISKDKYKDGVYLFPEEYQKLVKQFGEDLANKKIEALDDYIGSKGDKYKSHYKTILVWHKRDGGKNTAAPKTYQDGIDEINRKEAEKAKRREGAKC